MDHRTRCRDISETREEGSLDRISTLPDDLLANILSLLPTLRAVQTSILSSRWKYLFTLTNNINFDDEVYFGYAGLSNLDERNAAKTKFRRFVYAVLLLHRQSTIQKFSLKTGFHQKYDRSDFYVWITTAIDKGVQHLDLLTSYNKDALPNCIFNSRTLVTLNIHPHLYHLSVPELVYLPSLKSLSLMNVRFVGDADSVDRFFGGCPQLNELTLHYCQFTTDHVRFSAGALQNLTITDCVGFVVIDAPKLANLFYSCACYNAGLDVKNPCSLRKVHLMFCPSDMADDELPPALHNILRDAHYAREFALLLNIGKLLCKVGDDQIPTYPKLEILYLGDCCAGSWKYLVFWLANSPRLETIVFEAGLTKYYFNSMELDYYSDVAIAPLSSNLKNIQVHRFMGHEQELSLLKYLLENAGTLQRLILIKSRYMTMEQELNVSKELLLLPKVSAYCTIELV